MSLPTIQQQTEIEDANRRSMERVQNASKDLRQRLDATIVTYNAHLASLIARIAQLEKQLGPAGSFGIDVYGGLQAAADRVETDKKFKKLGDQVDFDLEPRITDLELKVFGHRVGR